MGRVLCAYGAASYPCPNPTRTHAVISVTAWSDNTTVYYDHWENGYGFDPTNPGTADETFILVNTGDQRVFESANIPTNPRRTTTCYDGGDRIYVAGGVVTVTRVGWIEAGGVGASRRHGRSTRSSRSSRPTSFRSARTCGWNGFQHVCPS